MGPVSIGVEVQRNTDGDTPSKTPVPHTINSHVLKDTKSMSVILKVRRNVLSTLI